MSADCIYGVSVNEVDHRIANNLAMVSGLLRRRATGLQKRTEPLSGAEASGVLQEAAFQIEVIANLHKLLSNRTDEKSIDLDQYLRSVCNMATPTLSSAGRVRPEARLRCGLVVAPEFAVSIALAIAELLTNAVKHAHPSGVDGWIAVTATCRGDQLVIEVADDGVGFPESYDPVADASFGLRLVHATAARWGGTVEFASSGLGVSARLVLPATAGQVRR